MGRDKIYKENVKYVNKANKKERKIKQNILKVFVRNEKLSKFFQKIDKF